MRGIIAPKSNGLVGGTLSLNEAKGRLMQRSFLGHARRKRRGMLAATRVLSALVLLSAIPPGSASAQSPQATVDKERKSHSFWDKTNVSLTIVEAGAITFDGITTQHALKNIPGTREGNPLARPFVSRGWPGQIVGGGIVVSTEVGVRYLLHRKGRHRLERFVPIILTAVSTAFAINNYRQIRQLNRLQ